MAQAAWDKKADNPVLLDVGSTSDVTDYFFVCSANSTRGVKTIVDNIEKTLEEAGEKVIGIEGYSDGNWVLIDSADVVAHIFYEPSRKFYDIESLWIDAPRVKTSFKDEIKKKPGVLQEMQAAE
ncbi:MAG: ribosome silencing factor [Thermodesulfobacteriota bacterium]|jgi:ribosome-associated protein